MPVQSCGRILNPQALPHEGCYHGCGLCRPEDHRRFYTMHRAKGLEFDCVVVLVEKERLGSIGEASDERKLVYVALTRAKWEVGMFVW